MFVGRAREIEQLGDAFDRARAGHGTTVLVTGEAGIGKTRLASEVATRARDTGFEVLLGRSMDLIGAELPYQPFVDALRPHFLGLSSGSRLRLFEGSLALLLDRAAASPVLLVLEDLHWADSSTLDLFTYLAHHLRDRRVILLATYRADEPPGASRIHRLDSGLRRSGWVLPLDLGPLPDEEIRELLIAQLPAALTDAVIARSEGNPFFAEELAAAAAGDGRLPAGLRGLLLQRMSKLDDRTREVLRLAATSGKDIAYVTLRATARLPEDDLRESLRQAVDHGLLLAEQASGSFRFRHALLAEAIYATILPGEREELHARLAEQLAQSDAAPAELARHWTVAGRAGEALAASVEAADQAEAAFGLAEALAHLERALELWEIVPDAQMLAKRDLVDVCSHAAELASQVGNGARAADLVQRAIQLAGPDDPHRDAFLWVRLGEYLYEIGRNEAALAALRHAVEIVPSQPPSAAYAYALGSLSGGLMLAWRHPESLPLARRALELARAVGDGDAEVRALTVIGSDLAYLGDAEEGLDYFRQAMRLAVEIGDRWGLERVYTNLTDVLTMLGRPGEAVRLGLAGLAELHRFGIESAVLALNTVEAQLNIGEWDDADRLSAEVLRSISASLRDVLHLLRARLELDRGDLVSAREHLEVGLAVLRQVQGLRHERGQGVYYLFIAELALGEHRWADADDAVRDALAAVRSAQAAPLRISYCAMGLRAQAELAALARAHRDTDAGQSSADRAGELIAEARLAAAQSTTLNGVAWLALAEAEHARVFGAAQPQLWSAAAEAWDLAERPPLAAYCRWQEAEALVSAGVSRTETAVPLRRAHAVAARIGAVPLLREIELLAQRARIPLGVQEEAVARPKEILGLTAREAEVLGLIARGYTNREIAAALVISVKTAGIHVSHILRKLGVPNRLEAAAVAHRLTR